MSEKFISYDNLKQYDEFLDKELNNIKDTIDKGFTFNVKYAESNEIGGAALKAINDENNENIVEHFDNIENDVAINKTTLGYQKKNLLKMNLKTTVKNGITVTVNDDNSVTINGTSSAQTDLFVWGSWASTTELLPENKYRLSIGVDKLSSYNGLGLRAINNTTSKAAATSINPEVVFSSSVTAFYITIDKGCTFDNYTIYPMLRYANITDDTYEPYVESVNERLQNFVKSGSGAKAGLVPAPSTTAGTTKYLREDGTWQVPPYLPVKSGYGLSQGLYSATVGTAGYILLCTIKITGTYQNTPTTIVYTQRNDSEAVYLSVSFASTNNTDPALNKFTYFGPSYVRAYIVKSATSTWQIYIQKTGDYDSISLLYYAKPYHSDHTTITWNDTQVTTLPTGHVKATRGGNVAYADKATYDKNGKDISTTYLPLAGGTMNEGAVIKIPTTLDSRYTEYKGGSIKNVVPTGSWAMGTSYYQTDDSTLIGAIGAQGTGNTVNYYYMGPIYDNPLFKLDTKGDGMFKGSCSATSFKTLNTNLISSGSITMPTELTEKAEITINNLSDYSTLYLELTNRISVVSSNIIPINYLLESTSKYISVPFHANASDDVYDIITCIMEISASTNKIILQAPTLVGATNVAECGSLLYKVFKI